VDAYNPTIADGRLQTTREPEGNDRPRRTVPDKRLPRSELRSPPALTSGRLPRCQRHVHVDMAQLGALADRYGRDAVLLDLIARLTCTDCRAKLDMRVHVPRLAKFGGRAN
jgi:hypothetical protein